MTAFATVDLCASRKVASAWDNLWTYQPTAEHDHALLRREVASKRWRMICNRLRRTFGRIQGLRTIELGSGRGDLSALLACEGADVTLLDTSEKALGQARSRFSRLGVGAQFQVGDLFEPPTTHERYDVALSSGVIEHFRGDQRTLSIQCHRQAVHDGGMVIISVPNAHCLPYRIWKTWLELRGCWPYGYELPFSRRELRRRTLAAGFERLEIRGFGFAQSASDQLLPLLGQAPDRNPPPDSPWDESMGLALILFAWNQ